MKHTQAYKLGRCHVQPLESSITFDQGEKFSLQPKFVEVLSYLTSHYPRIIQREELIEKIWDDNSGVGEKALTNAIWHLRKNLKGANGDAEVIETIRKVGYRLVVEPSWLQADAIKPSVQMQQRQLAQQATAPINSVFSRLWAKWSKLLLSAAALLVMLIWSMGQQPANFVGPQVTQITKSPGSELFVAPSPDGDYVVYKWHAPDDSSNLYMTDVAQPNVPAKQLTFDVHTQGHSVWSHDGKYLYFSRKDRTQSLCQIMRMRVVTKQERYIADCPMKGGYYYMDVSADGKTLAFLGVSEPVQDSGIYFIDLTKPSAQPYRFSCTFNCGYEDRDMAFSPDGKTLAVTRRYNRFSENIYLVDLATQQATQLTEGEEDIVGLTWHPDGERLVYAAQNADVRHGYVIDVGSKVRHDLNLPGFSYPAFAKQSGQLFYQQREEKYHVASLQLNDVVASSPFPVVQSDFNHHYPDYSSVRKQLVYVSNESGFYELWSANINGGNRQQLTDLKQTVGYPRWSHDGTKIAFLAPVAGEQGDKIHTLELSSNKISVVLSPFEQHNRPTWSFDDSAVISAIYDNEFTDLYQISLVGGRVKRLTQDGGRYGIMSSASHLLYTKIENGLWQKSIDNDAPAMLKINGEQFDTLYSWVYSPQGVYFKQTVEHHQQINFFDQHQRNITPIVRLPKRTAKYSGALTLAPGQQKLMFTSTPFPQADIKMLVHPLLQ